MSTPVVLITGALTGIGRAAALAFAKGGSRVVISGRHEEAGQALAVELRARHGGRVYPGRMKHELRVMLAQGSGSIFSSTCGHLGARGASVYSASKHAIEGLTNSAALETAASGVRINAVAPGPDMALLARSDRTTYCPYRGQRTSAASRKDALTSGSDTSRARLSIIHDERMAALDAARSTARSVGVVRMASRRSGFARPAGPLLS